MNRQYTLTEFGTICRKDDYPDGVNSLTALYLPDAAFATLKELAVSPDMEGALEFRWHQGRERLRTRNYVGLLETRSGLQLEILPKLTAPRAESAGVLSVGDHRLALLRMLRQVRHSPFRQAGMARVGAARLPLWEWVITAFLNDVSPMVKQGLHRAYVRTEANLPVLKGKWRVADQLQQSVHGANRFAVTYHAFTDDIPPNQLLKACLAFILPRARTLTNQTKCRQLLFALDGVSAPASINAALASIKANDRLRQRYAPVVRWSEVLLLHQSVGVLAGAYPTLSLLFPMERVFEEYVAAGFRRVVPAHELSIQESSAYLVDDHRGNPTFRLRPDLIIRQPGRLIVLDTKWKRIDGSGLRTNAGGYGIEQADLYQLYAYGKKYQATELVLIYPANETFTKPLQLFGYEATLPLQVVPFDVMNPPDKEVEKLMQSTLKGQ